MGTSVRSLDGDGPDWDDVLTAILKVEAHHQVRIVTYVMPDASRRGHLHVAVTATPDPREPMVSDAGDSRMWGTEGSLPAVGRDSFASRVWGMVITLDGVLTGERWRQQTLPDVVGP